MTKIIFLLFIIGILFVSIGYAAVPDADEDGVPDDDDRCPDSDTDIVDQFGCSCSQKNCPSDNNECTDDCSVIDGLPSCAFTNNNAPCPGGYCYEGKCSIIVKEQVKCLFEGSTDTEECYSEKGQCKGTEICIADVKGKKGEKITWKSSCGGYAYTIIDGQNEYAYFKCGNLSVTNISEQVKCLFLNSTEKQECYSEKGSCTGVESCSVFNVSGFKGEKVTWKSSCGQYAYTIIDGLSEYAIFQCDNRSLAEVKEQVKCVFLNSTTLQECYSEKGSCNSTETCVVDVKGSKGEEITWKSSCGGYAYTIIDGINEHAYFECGIQINETFPYNETNETFPVNQTNETFPVNETTTINLSNETLLTPPQPPFNLIVSATFIDELKIAKLEWQNVNGEKFYIYKNKNDEEFILLDSTSEKVYKDDVSKDVKYGYYVTALNRYGESDPSNTVYVYPIQLKSCAEQGGDICVGSLVCPGNSIKASDTERCCSVQCRTSSWRSCSQCGKGLFNLCDRTECNSIAESCYFIPARKCNRCAGASCESYTNQQTCDENRCNFDNCVWKENSCITS